MTDRASGREVSRVRTLPGRNVVVVDAKHAEMHDPANGEACVDRYENCRQRARNGECENGPGWMIMYCSRACDACHLRDPDVRCSRHALNMSSSPALHPGDMGSVFADFATRWARYSPRVLSTSPFVATLDDFISDAEIEAILGSVSSQFARSTDQGAVDKCGPREKEDVVVSRGRR